MMCLSGVGHRRWCRALSERRDPPRSSSDDLADDLHHPPRRTGGEHEAVAALVDEARVVELPDGVHDAAGISEVTANVLDAPYRQVVAGQQVEHFAFHLVEPLGRVLSRLLVRHWRYTLLCLGPGAGYHPCRDRLVLLRLIVYRLIVVKRQDLRSCPRSLPSTPRSAMRSASCAASALCPRKPSRLRLVSTVATTAASSVVSAT